MDRIVYILTPQGRSLECSLRLTRLMKWEAFSDVDVSRLSVLFGKKYASYLTPEHRSIVMGLMQVVKREGEWPILDGEYGYELLRKMLALKSVFFAFGGHKPLQWGEPVEGALGWGLAPGCDDEWETLVELPPGNRAFALNPPIYIDGEANACGSLAIRQPEKLAMRWLAARQMKVPAVSVFCLRLAKDFPEAAFPTPECARLQEADAVAPKALLTVRQRSVTEARERDEVWIDLRDRLRLRLRFQYGKALVEWDAAESAVSYREEGAIVRVARDAAWEKRIVKEVESWGFSSEIQAGDFGAFNFDGNMFSLGEGRSWRSVLEKTFQKLDTANWQVDYAKGMEVKLASPSDLYPEINQEDGDWFSMSYDLDVGGRREPLLPLLHGALRKRSKTGFKELLEWLRKESFALRTGEASREGIALVVLPDGAVAKLADHLYELFDRNPFDAGARARVNRWRLGELATAGLIDESCAEGVSAVVRLCERIGSGIDVKERKTPKNLNTKLRDYQRMGLGWLTALEEVSAGGILADEMGLGKTAQTIAHLLDLKQGGKLERGALIVAPTSVIDNWEDELERFAPSLKVARFHGKDREGAWSLAARSDIVITTYALLRLESERLQGRGWALAILDEAQYIKNASSRTAGAARGLRAERKLCLTGTPIENRLEDIWSLFEFLLPGFLGDENTFRTRIAQTLSENEESAFADELRSRLRQRLNPFVLRRKKLDVLKDLPERTEVIQGVSMSGRQRELYESYRQETRKQVGESLAAGGMAGACMLILARLMRLRQICCDPRLIEEERDAFDSDDSGKLNCLLELVQELIAQGSRILIFSQFTSMLELIGEGLEGERIDYVKLTGSTTDRADVVKEFQEGSAPVFLISLRAGGSGLNLTAADCVIHFDPWWNPAVERQASDRIHRIGQQKPVFIYKLIVDDSIESRIQHLQHAKLALVEDLLAEGNVERLEIDQDTLDYLLGD